MERIEPHVTTTTGRNAGFQVSRIANETVLHNLYITGDKNMKIRVLSLFDGISVGMLALKRAGFDVEKYYASEIKTKAMKCSFNNWGDAIEQIGDVRKVDGKNMMLTS